MLFYSYTQGRQSYMSPAMGKRESTIKKKLVCNKLFIGWKKSFKETCILDYYDPLNSGLDYTLPLHHNHSSENNTYRNFV